MRCRPEIRNRSDGEGMSKDNVTVGFVGLGTMGGRMAANVQRAGFRLIVHDLHRQAASHHLADGAVWADSPAALARQADVIFSSLPEPSDVEAVALGQAVRQGAAGRRFTFDALIDQFLPGKYDPPAFALKLAHKDVSLANALGRELGVPMRMCNLTLAEMTEALARGWGGRDSRSVMLLQQERAGVEIAVDPERLREALAPAVPQDSAKPGGRL